MKLAYSPEHEALRQELRAYYAKLLTPEIREEVRRSEGVGPIVRKVVRQMGADGWLGIGWPKEYGGRGMTPIEQFIFFDESMRVGAPVPMLTVNSVAPTIMQFGTEEQKKFFLPKILKGEIHFAIGYTEPDAGTDLASLQTRAVRDGDFFVINGQKIFTSLATDADYIWLAVRTDPDAPEAQGHLDDHRAARDARLPRARRSRTWASINTNQTFYDDVRVPVGEPGRQAERRLEADHQPAQPRARHAVQLRDDRGTLRGGRRAGRSRRRSPTAAASSISRGCSSTSPASTRASTSCG